MTHFLLILALGQAAGAPAGQYPGPHQMTRAEIRAYNANLDRNDPAYIRCKREQEIGSLVRTTTTCKTNEEWRAIEAGGNEDARAMVEQVNRSGSSNGN